MKITALEYKPKHMIAVYLSSGETLIIHEDVLVSLGLYKGMDISQELVQKAIEQDHFHRAKNRALYYLGFGPRSKHQMKTYLVQRDYPPQIAEEVVHWLESHGFMNDVELAQRYVEDWTVTKANGPTWMKHKLWEKGFDAETIEAICWPTQEELYQSALLLAQKKWPTIKGQSLYEKKGKLYQFLARRGYASESIRSIIEEVAGDE